MKKYLSIMLLIIAAVFVSCGNDEKDEPTYKNPPKLDTAYFKGKAFQNMDDVNNYKIFTNGQREIEFTVKESEKKLWLYTDLLFEVKTKMTNRISFVQEVTEDRLNPRLFILTRQTFIKITSIPKSVLTQTLAMLELNMKNLSM